MTSFIFINRRHISKNGHFCACCNMIRMANCNMLILFRLTPSHLYVSIQFSTKKRRGFNKRAYTNGKTNKTNSLESDCRFFESIRKIMLYFEYIVIHIIYVKLNQMCTLLHQMGI